MKLIFSKLPLIFSILFFIASVSLLAFLYVRINKDNISAETMETEWQAEYDRQEDLKSLDSSMKAVEKEKAMLETHFAQSSDVVPFLDTLEQLASAPGAEAEIMLVNVSDDKSSLQVGIKAIGSFESVYKFLLLLENSAYELEFMSVDLQNTNAGSEGESSSSLWVANISVKLLSFVK